VTTTRPSTPHPPSRDGSVTASPPNEGTCWGCQQVLPDGRAGRRYCSARCRQAGWRRRHPTDPAPTTTRAPKTRSRREHTVYACDECGARYLAQQWCHDCTRPARRLGAGGACGHCSELLTVDELLTDDLDT